MEFNLKGPSLIALEGGLNIREEIEWKEAFVGTGMEPAGLEAELVANLKPVSDLLDGRLFEVDWERSLAWAGSRAGGDAANDG